MLSRLQYLGIQDAVQKTRPPSRNIPSAWAGTVFLTDQDTVRMTVMQEKWDKAKVLLEEVW